MCRDYGDETSYDDAAERIRQLEEQRDRDAITIASLQEQLELVEKRHDDFVIAYCEFHEKLEGIFAP